MSSIIPGSCFIQEDMCMYFGFVFIGLVIAAHPAQSEEGSFSPKKDILTIKLVSSNTDWQPSYRLNMNAAINRLEDSVPPVGLGGLALGSTTRPFPAAETKKEADWSINLQKQIPLVNDCSSLSSLLCFDSKEERPDIKPLRDSFWVVWRKALPF